MDEGEAFAEVVPRSDALLHNSTAEPLRCLLPPPVDLPLTVPRRARFRLQYWEGAVAEAPFLHFHLDRFYLYYSANDYYNSLYAIGYATSAHLEGPYKKPGHPWQDTSNTGNGNVRRASIGKWQPPAL